MVNLRHWRRTLHVQQKKNCTNHLVCPVPTVRWAVHHYHYLAGCSFFFACRSLWLYRHSIGIVFIIWHRSIWAINHFISISKLVESFRIPNAAGIAIDFDAAGIVECWDQKATLRRRHRNRRHTVCLCFFRTACVNWVNFMQLINLCAVRFNLEQKTTECFTQLLFFCTHSAGCCCRHRRRCYTAVRSNFRVNKCAYIQCVRMFFVPFPL